MRAIILAGGKGTRLRPYTHIIPKPLVPIGDKYSILEIVIKQLVMSGFTHITITINHLSHLIKSFFGNGSSYGIKIDYSLEEKPLSTIGPLTLINDLPEDFLVMNGDILTDMNYSDFFKFHANNTSPITVASKKKEVRLDFGLLAYDEGNKLTSFKEKPTFVYDVSMGIYCLNKSVIKNIEINTPYGFDDLMRDSIHRKESVLIYPYDGYWVDIGRHEDYEQVNKNYAEIYEMLNV